MQFDLATMDAKPQYNLLTSLIVPRPIAWVTSASEQGRLNAAPFSFFNLASTNPPVVCLGIGERAGRRKDTAENIARTGEFVVNLVSRPLAGKMVATAIEFGAEIDEVAEVGMAVEASSHVAPPRLAASPVALECVTMQIVALGSTRSIVIARIVAVHVDDTFVLDRSRGHVDTPALGLIGRMHGGGWYTDAAECFQLPRIALEDWLSVRSEVVDDVHDAFPGLSTDAERRVQ